MNTYCFEGVVTAQTSISHIGETRGINAKLRREKIIQPDGTVEEIPVISGNAVRGILRDRGMLHMLKYLGYGVNEQTGEVNGLSLAAFYFLFSGGALTKEGGNGIDIDKARTWRELIPLVAVFGGAMGNQIMPGKLKCGKLIPICKETAHIIPDRFCSDLQSIWDMCQEEAYTRRDDEKNENLRALIAPEVRGLIEGAASKKKKKIDAGEDDVAGETGQKQQMRYFIETLAAGSRFFWDLSLDDVSSIEFDAFCVALSEFSRFPYIGGKSNVGHGKVIVNFEKWMSIDSRADMTGTELGFSLGVGYRQHLQQRADDIRKLINGLE